MIYLSKWWFSRSQTGLNDQQFLLWHPHTSNPSLLFWEPSYLTHEVMSDTPHASFRSSCWRSLAELCQSIGYEKMGKLPSQQRWLFWRIRKWFCRSNRANARNRSAQMKILDQFPNIETHHNLPRACCVLPRYFSMVGILSFFHATDRVRLPFALVDVLGPYTIPVTCDLPGRRTCDVSVPISGMVKKLVGGLEPWNFICSPIGAGWWSNLTNSIMFQGGRYTTNWLYEVICNA